MREFSQELVDSVIDELFLSDPRGISRYSTVSKRWSPRIQRRLFEFVEFRSQGRFESWCETVTINPSGVSQYVCRVGWERINTFVGFEDHLRAFTKVGKAYFRSCVVFCFPSEVQLLSSLGSSLVRLEIYESMTTPSIMASLCGCFPCLRQLIVEDLQFQDDSPPSPGAETPTIPLFEGSDEFEMTLLCQPRRLGRLDWISPTAQFENLTLEGPYVSEYPEMVNRLITSSGKSLKHFYIHGDFADSTSIPLDFSECTSLETLRFTVPLRKSEKLANSILSSISSSDISTVILDLAETRRGWDDPHGRVVLEDYLCRLAKQFSDAQGGEKMTVEIYLVQMENYLLFTWFQDGKAMPNLHKVAKIVIREIPTERFGNRFSKKGIARRRLLTQSNERS